MTLLHEFAAFHHRGADLLELIHDASETALATLGFSKREAKRLTGLSKTYFGPCRTPARQRNAVAAARENRHSLETLHMIRTVARKRLDGGDPFELIVEFCQLSGSFEEIEEQARRRVEDINLTVADRKSKAFGRRSATISTTATADGLKSLLIKGPADDIDALEAVIRPDATRRMRENRRLSRAQATYDALMATRGAARKVYRPVVAMSLSTAHRILEGDGDEVRVAASDGQVMTGAEFINSQLSDDVYFALVHPEQGPINLYREARTANSKQRTLLEAESLVCARPGCNKPAMHSEIHHINAFKLGGRTNLEEMAVLCGEHNGLNDDDPDQPRNGRIERINGRIYHVNVDGAARRNTSRPAQMGIMDVINED